MKGRVTDPAKEESMSRVTPDQAPDSPAPANGHLVDDLRSTIQRLAALADALQAREAALQAREKEFEQVLAQRDHYKAMAFSILIDQANRDFADLPEDGDLGAWAIAKGGRPLEDFIDELFPPRSEQ
jgi:hypothetical protein